MNELTMSCKQADNKSVLPTKIFNLCYKLVFNCKAKFATRSLLPRGTKLENNRAKFVPSSSFHGVNQKIALKKQLTFVTFSCTLYQVVTLKRFFMKCHPFSFNICNPFPCRTRHNSKKTNHLSSNPPKEQSRSARPGCIVILRDCFFPMTILPQYLLLIRRISSFCLLILVHYSHFLWLYFGHRHILDLALWTS